MSWVTCMFLIEHVKKHWYSVILLNSLLMLASHKKLRSRIGMRNLRNSGKNDAELNQVPADDAGKAAYKSKLRAQLQKEGRL